MFIKTLYRLGLTHLTQEEVDAYQRTTAAVGRGPYRWIIAGWGALSILMCALLVVFGISLVPVVQNGYRAAALQRDLTAIGAMTLPVSQGAPPPATRGPNPILTLRRANKLVEKYKKDVADLRLQAVDFSSRHLQEQKLTQLKREVAELSEAVEAARQEVRDSGGR